MLETKLVRIAKRSKEHPDAKFDKLMPLFNLENLTECFHSLRVDGAIGLDRVTKDEYGSNLKANLENLIGRMKSMSYRPQPVRQVEIPKPQGGTRPLGISCVEDKIIQQMCSKILEAIFEPQFRQSSYGFRPGRNCHQAIGKVSETLFKYRKCEVIDVDLENYFGTIDHDNLLGFIGTRIEDKTFMRYMVRIMRSGIMTKEGFKPSRVGVPQGAICSPILSNIYAHYVIDEWMEDTVGQYCNQTIHVRYCDDLVIIVPHQKDTPRVLKGLKNRLNRYHLRLNETKTKIAVLDRTRPKRKSETNTFSFLGFSYVVGKSRRGVLVPKIISDPVRVRNKLKIFKVWARKALNRFPMKEVWKKVILMVSGYARYYGVSGNLHRVNNFIYQVKRIIFKWSNRRSQKKSLTFEKFDLFIRANPLPPTKVYHQLYKKI
jgi:RNA-directed DNA polymerase